MSGLNSISTFPIMKASLIIKSVTQNVGSESLRLMPPERKPADTSKATVSQGSNLSITNTDPALFGSFEPGQVVTLTIE
jgi:hypothetical protein